MDIFWNHTFRFCLLVWKGPGHESAFAYKASYLLVGHGVLSVRNSLVMTSWSYSFFVCFVYTNTGVSTVKISCQQWNLLADYCGKIPHNELITIAKVQCT